MSPLRANSVWQPLLSPEESAPALAAAEEIAAALRQRLESPEAQEPLPLGRSPFSLGGGWPGQALFFAYLDQVFPDRGYDDTAIEMLELTFEELGRRQASPDLFSGLAGVAWTVEHFRGWLIDEDGEDSGEAIAEGVAGLLETSPWPLEYDLISGLVGYGTYGLERLPLSHGREIVERALARLGERAERGPGGVSWWSAEENATPVLRFDTPGHYNLGVAHGVPGAIGWLGQVCASGLAAEEASSLLGGAVRWLLDRQSPAEHIACFPHAWVPGRKDLEEGEEAPTRLAWCYGDVGIAAALLTAARGAQEPAWTQAALEIALTAARRTRKSAGVVDAGLCHGSAGNSHFFNRCWQATGDPACAEAARSWLADALAMRKPGEGIAGFLTFIPGGEGGKSWHADPGFLTGAAGIGLALLATASAVEPAWDRVLLAS